MKQQLQTVRKIEDKVRRAFRGSKRKFRPFVSFDPVLDRIMLVVRDCSTTEEAVKGGILTVFEDNYPKGRHRQRYIGVAFDNVERRTGLSPHQLEVIADFFNKVVAKCDPESVETLVNNLGKQLCQMIG